MLDLILVGRIILIAITSIFLLSAVLNEKKNKWDWLVILYLAVIIFYFIMR